MWGGGLGDLLVMRPLLQALSRRNLPAPVYLTTAWHLPGLFEALGLSVEVLRLPHNPLSAVSAVRSMGRFAWVYCGPRVSSKVNLLQKAVRADRRLYLAPETDDSFIGDDIVNDVQSFGFSDFRLTPYGTLPLFPAARACELAVPAQPYLVFHPGAKDGWKTKQWPIRNWRDFIEKISKRGWCIQLVGVPSERETLFQLLTEDADSERVIIRTDLDLWGVERLIAGADGVVCHNSGVMHIAAAYRRKILVLNGSSAMYWRPNYPWLKNIDSGACSMACNRYRCPVPGFRAKCIRTLKLEDVLFAFENHIGVPPNFD